MAGKTKYKVGDEFYGSRRIVEYCGSHQKWRVSMWKWECLGCGTIHGPSMTSTLTRKDREDSLPRCCEVKSRSGDLNARWAGYRDISGVYFSQIKTGASKRNLNFNISIQDMQTQWDNQNGKCALSGQALSFKSKTASLDRIDSALGYEKSNIQWIHKTLNWMKRNMPESEFIYMCKAVADFSAGRI